MKFFCNFLQLIFTLFIQMSWNSLKIHICLMDFFNQRNLGWTIDVSLGSYRNRPCPDSVFAVQLSQLPESSHMNGFTGKLETQESTNWHFYSHQLVKRSFIFSLDQQILKLQAQAVEQVIVEEQLNNRLIQIRQKVLSNSFRVGKTPGIPL